MPGEKSMIFFFFQLYDLKRFLAVGGFEEQKFNVCCMTREYGKINATINRFRTLRVWVSGFYFVFYFLHIQIQESFESHHFTAKAEGLAQFA
jgi:recombinational DNA repair protein (RecF pathway)